MNPDEANYVGDLQERVVSTEQQLNFEQSMRQEREMLQTQREMLSIAVEQLSMAEELERMDNLLRGRYLSRDENGDLDWREPIDESSIILSEAGVQFVLNSLNFYLNKNTLLSNYDNKTILEKMEDYATSLCDALFMRSDVYFREPTYNEVVNEFKKQLERKIEKEIAIRQIRGLQYNEEQIKQRFLSEVNIEKRLEDLKKQLKNDRLRNFEHLMRQIQDSVHSTYLRALFGQERKTLRQQIHISEMVGAPKPPIAMTERGRGGILGLFRR